MTEAIKKLTYEQAEKLLPLRNIIHTFRQVNGLLLGADWPREKILERFKSHGVELAGINARKANHGLCSYDSDGPLFIENLREVDPTDDIRKDWLKKL